MQFMSRLASDLIINAFDTPWSPHDDLGKSWKSYLTFFWKVSTSFITINGQNSDSNCSSTPYLPKELFFLVISQFCNMQFSQLSLHIYIPITQRGGE